MSNWNDNPPLLPAVNVIKYFSTALMKSPNKLECLFMVSLSSLVYLQLRPEPNRVEDLK
jgi:hypothetical protein